MSTETAKIGKRGTLVIPSQFRRKFGFTDGSLVIAEETQDGLLIKPAKAVEVYSPERIAEFLLSNAIGVEEYGHARTEVFEMGLDPDNIPHFSPLK